MKLISFCVYGDSVKYILGLYDNIVAAKTIYPDWKIRVYVPSCSYLKDKIPARFPHVEVIVKEPIVELRCRMWRFESMWDENYSHVIIRDTDSIITNRERDLVNQWIASDSSLHVMYDHPHHNAPMLSGMIGCKPSCFAWLKDHYEKWYIACQDDTEFLMKVVYPFVDSVLTHTSVNNPYAKGEIIQIEEVEDFIGRPRTPDLLSWINCFYVLNPDRYAERYRRFLSEINKSEILSNMQCIRVRGCTYDEEFAPYWTVRSRPHYWLANQDHKRMLRDALIRKDDLTLILEDDATLCEDFDSKFLAFIRNSDHCLFSGKVFAPWSALMLGGSPMNTIYCKMERMTTDLQRSVGTYGMQSILYNYKGLHDFYAHALYWNAENIDVAFAGYQKQVGTVYAPNEWLIEQSGPQVGSDT